MVTPPSAEIFGENKNAESQYMELTGSLEDLKAVVAYNLKFLVVKSCKFEGREAHLIKITPYGDGGQLSHLFKLDGQDSFRVFLYLDKETSFPLGIDSVFHRTGKQDPETETISFLKQGYFTSSITRRYIPLDFFPFPGRPETYWPTGLQQPQEIVFDNERIVHIYQWTIEEITGKAFRRVAPINLLSGRRSRKRDCGPICFPLAACAGAPR